MRKGGAGGSSRERRWRHSGTDGQHARWDAPHGRIFSSILALRPCGPAALRPYGPAAVPPRGVRMCRKGRETLTLQEGLTDRTCNNLRMDADKQICGLDPDSQYLELAVEVFGLLADVTRVRIILALRRSGELSVNHLADIVDKTPAAVSQHLAKLRLARIVATRQAGQRVFYRLENEHASQLVTDAIFQAEHALDGSPRHHHSEKDDA